MARVYLVSVLLWALLPFQGLAQAPSPPPLVPAASSPDPDAPEGASPGESPDGGYDGEEPSRGELIPHRWESSGDVGLGVPRIALEALVGFGLGFVGVVPGSLYLMSISFCEDCDVSTSSILFSLGLATVGLTGGVALGVKVGGALMGGAGRFLPTLLGATLGFVGGVFAAFPLSNAFDGGWIVSLFLCPITGAVIGYELSHAYERESSAAVGTQVGWIPLISVRPSGGLVAGLAGHF
ncbi:MAG: hypothetical protein ACJ8AT_10850 [Hyalangium sp.]|uniref:hypothetical protein n=1 Tax=Hyalangium sp. TaxID=2028555 RepID=UPI00389A93FD